MMPSSPPTEPSGSTAGSELLPARRDRRGFAAARGIASPTRRSFVRTTVARPARPGPCAGSVAAPTRFRRGAPADPLVTVWRRPPAVLVPATTVTPVELPMATSRAGGTATEISAKPCRRRRPSRLAPSAGWDVGVVSIRRMRRLLLDSVSRGAGRRVALRPTSSVTSATHRFPPRRTASAVASDRAAAPAFWVAPYCSTVARRTLRLRRVNANASGLSPSTCPHLLAGGRIGAEVERHRADALCAGASRAERDLNVVAVRLAADGSESGFESSVACARHRVTLVRSACWGSVAGGDGTARRPRRWGTAVWSRGMTAGTGFGRPRRPSSHRNPVDDGRRGGLDLLARPARCDRRTRRLVVAPARSRHRTRLSVFRRYGSAHLARH